MVLRCPECGSNNISVEKPCNMHNGATRCGNCGLGQIKMLVPVSYFALELKDGKLVKLESRP